MNRRHRRRSTRPARCHEVARTLQAYLDGHVDEMTARRVERHLEACRRCGFERAAYESLKRSLARRTPIVDELALERLRSFARHLMDMPPAVGGPVS